jgi:hypothetical protein
MSDRVVLNTPRFTGEFPLDLKDDPMTALEWRWVKKISGYLPMTVDEGVAGLDPDLFIAFAVIALYRAGKIDKAEALIVAETISELPATPGTLQVVFEAEEEEAEQDPPTVATLTPKESGSGSSSSRISDPLAPVPSPTGTTESVRSAI